ncbi:flavodoxin [Anaerobacillus alkaliphilus]|uniref:Flavodoxin n=1 Tax=Anaerobacillus alkaliphilus TaxID=1548597 RepID=A0A4Q0VKX3_9BACI|nr:flavodoxin domain-containing protein [Anaerobacillus alkaliphilus]RXI95531.1 flavodoxin [Anaerobacillus alkaliphilus]
MDTVIIYASSHGTTEKAAKMLGQKITGQVTIIDLKKIKNLDLEEFDQVIIGGSIHAGMIQRKVTNFMKRFENELLAKRLGLFLCCMREGESANVQFEQSYPQVLREHSKANGLFGGEFLFGKMNYIEKTIIKKMKGDTEDVSTLDEKAINEFAKSLLDY